MHFYIFGQIERYLRTVLDHNEPRRGRPVASVSIVGRRIDPHAGEHMHGSRQLSEWRIEDGIGKQQALSRWCGPHRGQPGSVEDLYHLLRGLPPTGF